MSLPEVILQRIGRLLSARTGTDIHIISSAPITEGWTAHVVHNPWPWVVRCTVRSGSALLPHSVIVKLRRPDDHLRNEAELLVTERAALEFLAAIGTGFGPRLLAADDASSMLVMEDLGVGPALEDLLVGTDARAAEYGLITFATALGEMHASTVGHASEYYRLRSRYGPIDPTGDRLNTGGGIARAWHTLQAIVAERSYLPAPGGVSTDIDALLGILAEPGPYLAFSNGDTCPNNFKWATAGQRFLDFEHAAFRHALLDATSLRFPFPACPCWSRLPEHVGRRAEDAYRAAFARVCPEVCDDVSYKQGLTAACAAWTLVRLTRLPKLEQADAPHPMNFSRRGQVLDDISTTLNCARQSKSLANLAAWLDDLSTALRQRWPECALRQRDYPAFGSSSMSS